MSKRYILQEPLPGIADPIELQWDKESHVYHTPYNLPYYSWGRHQIEEDKDGWFKEIQPEVENKEWDNEVFDGFEHTIHAAINSKNLESISNTPDYISAKFVRTVFESFNKAIKERDKWYGLSPEPAQSKQPIKPDTKERISVNLKRMGHCDPRIKPLEIIIYPTHGIAEWQLPLINNLLERFLNGEMDNPQPPNINSINTNTKR